MSRITAGRAKNTKLYAAPDTTRPITDRIKTSLFDSLKPVLAGAKCLDLYAGSGAIGLEAVSRGAKSVIFVESNPEACELIIKNSRKSGLYDSIQLIESSVEEYLSQKIFEKFDLIFLDPPFKIVKSEKQEILKQSAKFLENESYLIFRHPQNEKYPKEIIINKKIMKLVLLKKYGKSKISIYQKLG